jgi:hypothetical protein
MPQTGSTQSTLSILDIKDDVLIMPNGVYRMVLRVKAINFDLLSEEEQDSIIYAYASLINALEFPIQVMIRTRQMHIDAYLQYLETAKKSQPSQALRDQITSYQQFVNKLVIENNVLFKTFYAIIPYETVLNNKASIFDSVKSAIPGQPVQQTYSVPQFEEARAKLIQRRDQLIGSFQRIGLRAAPLATKELIELFYELYNPEVGGAQQLHQEIDDYTTPLVHPSVQ